MEDSMAYTVPPGTSRVRPTVVTVAASLLGLAAVDQLVSAGVGASVLGTMRDAYQRAYEGAADADTVVTVMNATTIVTIAVGVVIAMALGILALLNARGKQPARIISWVLGGLYLCCATFSLAGNALSSAFTPNSSGTGSPDAAEVTKIVNDALPSWYSAASLALSVISLLAVLGAVVLLALPAANGYFRKPAQQWEPPLPPQQWEPPFPPTGR
jgi:hypothetical protein